MSSSIIQDLIDEGVVALYHDYRSGSFRDWSGNSNHGVPTGGAIGRRGYLTKGTGGIDVAYTASLALSGSSGCSVISYMSEKFQWNSWPSPRLYDQSGGIISYITSGTSWVFNINATGSLLVDVAGHAYRCFGVSWTADEKPLFYGDGVYAGEGNVALAANASTNKIVIANNTGGGIRPLHNVLAATLMVSRPLTATEQSKVYAELRSYDESWPTKVFARNRGYVNIDPNETGLVAGYRMRPDANQLVDISPNGYDLTLTGPVYNHSPIGPAMRFQNTTETAQSASSLDLAGISYLVISQWLKTSDSDGELVGKWYASGSQRSFSFFLVGGRLGLYLSSAGGATEQESGTSRVDDGLWYHIAAVYNVATSEVSFYINGALDATQEFTTETGVPFNSTAVLSLGRIPNGFVAGGLTGSIFANVKIRVSLVSASTLGAEYQEGARAVLFKTDWGARETIANVTSGFISNTPFQVLSGTWRIITEEVDGKQRKVLECVGTGILYIPTPIFQVGTGQAAYGGWEIWVNQYDSSSNFRLAFIANQATNTGDAAFYGYGLTMIGSSRYTALFEYTAGAASTKMRQPNNSYDFQTWYKYRINRTNASAFSVYIDDTPLDPNNGGSGTNPVTDATTTASKYMVMVAYTGDKICLGDLKGGHSFIKYLGAVVYDTDGDFPVPEPPS